MERIEYINNGPILHLYSIRGAHNGILYPDLILQYDGLFNYEARNLNINTKIIPFY